MQLRKLISLALCFTTLSLYGQSIEVNKSLFPFFIPKAPLPPNPSLPKLLDGTKQPKFVNKLVNVIDDDFIFKPRKKVCHGTDLYIVSRVPFIADLGIINEKKHRLYTPMFGYASKGQKPTYPGRTVLVESKNPIKVFWKNELVNKKNGMPLPEPRYVPVDETIHLAMPENPPYPQSGIPTVVHLHGGFTEELSDGYPEAWNTPNFAQVGPFFKKKVYTYSNNQEAMMLWYHDHALGFTRLTNYAGLIGSYIIRDKREKQLIREHKIPSGHYEVPLIITDKMFTTEGQLFFPYYNPEEFPDEPQPSVLPEFFGDFILVNGKTWPYQKVEPRKYRFRVLNACDSRFLNLQLVKKSDASHPIHFYQIGTDQGLLNEPVKISELLIAPAQRADLVIDFSRFKGKTLIVTNNANAPFPDGDPVDPNSTGLVMAFKVTEDLDKNHHETHLPKRLRKNPIKRLKPTAEPRRVLLFETEDSYGRTLPLLGTPELGALHWDAPITEIPVLGTTEIWEIYNTTEDAHPIHLHAGNFEIVDRQLFSGDLDPVTGVLQNIQLIGKPMKPGPTEKGLFDTVIVPPKTDDDPPQAVGMRTRIIMKFALPGQYVWHCHIISHEDNDMMRPMHIIKVKKS